MSKNLCLNPKQEVKMIEINPCHDAAKIKLTTKKQYDLNMKVFLLFFSFVLFSGHLEAREVFPSDSLKRVVHTTKSSNKKDKKKEVVLPVIDTTSLYVNPVFKGGDKAMYDFFEQNLRYPRNADRNGIKGTVDIICTITQEGKLKNFKIIKPLGFGCNEEAMRLVKLLPDWEIAKVANRPVEVKVVITVPFKY